MLGIPFASCFIRERRRPAFDGRPGPAPPPAERIRGLHDPILRRTQSLIGRGQGDGTFRSDLPGQWLITTAFSLMHAAAEDAVAGRVTADEAPRLITATLLAAFTPPATPPAEGRQP